MKNLVITALDWDAENQPKPGTPITFSVAVKNEGIQEESATVTVFVDRVALPEIRLERPLKQGKTHVFESVVWEATAGNHVITAVLNGVKPTPRNFGTGVTFTKNLRVCENALSIPAPAAAAGMNTLTFSDDFTDASTIDWDATGDVGYKWYLTLPFGAPDTKPEDMELTKDGILLKKKNIVFNYGLGMMDIKTGAGWGYTHGYMEARIRVPKDCTVEKTKHHPSIWALSPEMMWCKQPEYVELDFLEYWGTKFCPEYLYTVTIHQIKTETPPNEPQKIVFHANNFPASHHYGLGDEEWHTMGWLWEKGSLTTYLDGEKLFTQTWSKDGDPTPSFKVGVGEHKPGIFELLDHQLLPVTICGGEEFSMEVAYLNVWQTK